MVARNSSLARWSKSCPWIMRICFRKVDLPLSPAPSSNIFTSRFTYVFSRLIHLSISLDFLCCSTSLLDNKQLGIQTIAVREGRKSAIFVVTTSWIHHWRERAPCACTKKKNLGGNLASSFAQVANHCLFVCFKVNTRTSFKISHEIYYFKLFKI